MPPQPGQIFSLKKQQRSNDLYSTTQGESDDIFGNILLKTYQEHQKQNKQNLKRVLFQNEATISKKHMSASALFWGLRMEKFE